QLNPVIGDLSGNAARIHAAVERAAAAGADLCVTPELSLVGYPPRDLLLDDTFITRTAQVLGRLAIDLRHLVPTLVGVPARNYGNGRPLFTSPMLLRDGRIAARFRKSLLPTYDVFDEDRYFEPGDGVGVIAIGGARVAVSVCEDVWGDEVTSGNGRRYQVDPIRRLEREPLDCFINVSASPFVVGKQRVRERLLGEIARRLQ